MVLYPHSNNCNNNIIHFFGHAFNFFTSKRVKYAKMYFWPHTALLDAFAGVPD